MNNQPDDRYGKAWKAACRRLARALTLGWFLETFGPAAFGLSVAAVIVVAAGRQSGLAIDSLRFLPCAFFVGALAWSAICAFRRRVMPAKALELLDERLGLCNALSAAAAGVIQWPNPPTTTRVVVWRWSRSLVLGVTGCCLFAFASFLPARDAVSPASGAKAVPLAIAKTERLLEDIAKEKTIDEESLARVERQIEAFRDLPKSEWYEHETLEAAETLRESTEAAAKESARKLERAADLLSEMAKAAARKDSEALKDLSSTADQMARELGDEPMQPSDELRQALQRAAKEEALMANPPDLEAAERQLRDGASRTRQALEGAPDKSGKNGDDRDSRKSDGPAGGDGSGRDRNEKQKEGGISRGPGTAPLDPIEKPPQMTSNVEERLADSRADESQFRDLAGLSPRKPEEEKPGQFDDGGRTSGRAGAAQPSWKEAFTPDEIEILKRFNGEDSGNSKNQR